MKRRYSLVDVVFRIMLFMSDANFNGGKFARSTIMRTLAHRNR